MAYNLRKRQQSKNEIVNSDSDEEGKFKNF